ncbi:MAG: hypothetical protein ABW039_13970 [Sphingobium sp.]
MFDYAKQRDELILLLGNSARNSNQAVNLKDFIPDNLPSFPKDLIHQVARDLDNRGLGKVQFSIQDTLFYPSGACIEVADEIAFGRTVRGKFSRIPRSDWISIIALIVAIVALLKPGS